MIVNKTNILRTEDLTARLANMRHAQLCSVKAKSCYDVIPTVQSTSVHLTWQLLGFDTLTEHGRVEGER